MANQPDWEVLLAPDSQWLRILCCPERFADEFMLNLPCSKEIVARVLRGKRCTTPQTLFQEWAAALQFPYYFGENWDAFEECLGDLQWLPANHYIFLISHADQALRDSSDSFATFINILRLAAERGRIAEETESPPLSSAPLRFIFHCDPNREALVRKRLQEAGLEQHSIPTWRA